MTSYINNLILSNKNEKIFYFINNILKIGNPEKICDLITHIRSANMNATDNEYYLQIQKNLSKIFYHLLQIHTNLWIIREKYWLIKQ